MKELYSSVNTCKTNCNQAVNTAGDNPIENKLLDHPVSTNKYKGSFALSFSNGTLSFVLANVEGLPFEKWMLLDTFRQFFV